MSVSSALCVADVVETVLLTALDELNVSRTPNPLKYGYGAYQFFGGDDEFLAAWLHPGRPLRHRRHENVS